ncbi:MAG: AcvB/VirJ family lysyl-phosphatidylglycerol hydrolase [Deltaproteobacteria bacterium]|jgi:type IV secretory pathway VirJ component
MNFTRNPVGLLLFAFSILAIMAGLVWVSAYKNFPVLQDVISDEIYGNITVARPLIMYRELVVVFADIRRFHAGDLARRTAQSGAAVAIVDTARAMQALASSGNHCLTADRVMEPMGILSNWAKASKDKRSIMAGIGDGGLLPLLSAGTKSGGASRNLSIDFSAQLPEGYRPCSPLTSAMISGHQELTSSPALNGKWLAVWIDQPEAGTAVFVRGLLGAKTAIAPYDTPLDTVTVDEIQKIIAEENRTLANPLPIVEVPAKNPNDTVTLFYSGDGGWRDLDRDVAEQMADLGYPVVGVDTLRYFWSGKTPEEAANDLAAAMTYYRTAWKAKTFVLAGYSFGADILPAVYNRLSDTDQESVALIVLLALSRTADFEIHVSGWVGKSSNGVPILPELGRIQGNKILCITGQEEKVDSACAELSTTGARLMDLPGGHHFDQDYPKLTMRIHRNISTDRFERKQLGFTSTLVAQHPYETRISSA